MPKSEAVAYAPDLYHSIGKDKPDFNYFVKIYLW